MSDVVLTLCRTCLAERKAGSEEQVFNIIDGELTDAGVAEAVTLRTTDCMSGCATPVTLGLQGQGRASYVFAGLSPIEDAADIAATVKEYLTADDGWIEDARACGRLRQCLRARLPAMD